MGDNETMVAETSMNEYTSNEYASKDCTAVNTDPVSDVGVSDSGGTDTNSVTLQDGACGTIDGSAVGDTNSVMQDAPVTSAYDNRTTVAPADYSGNTVKQENAVVESNQAGAYDSLMNGNGVDEAGQFTSMGNDANGTSDASGAVEQQFAEAPVLSTEEERLWSIVKANSLDFNSWTALIEETERVAEDNTLKIRKIYDAFLAEFPLCYGYWKKYAEHEARLSPIEKVVEVFERAVAAVTYSVDMWLHYCVFVISTYGDPDKVRRLFERGLAYVGTDYLSFPLWDKYIEYEYQLQQWCHLATIYTRILENPNQQLDRYFNSFKELAGSQPLSELRTAEEAAAVAASALNLEASVKVENEIHPDGVHDLVGASSTEAEELENYVAVREEMYKKAKEFDSKIISFETSIRRPYFHVRPLNGSELENWHSYLDFIERDGDLNKLSHICCIICLFG